MTHATESSSGVSSVESRSLDPTPTPASFAPNYGPTPSVHFADEVLMQEGSDGSRLATLVAQSLSVSQNRVPTSGQSSALPSAVRFMSYGYDTQNSKLLYQ